MDGLFRSFFGLRRGNDERDYFGDMFHGTPHFGQPDDMDDEQCCQADFGEEGEIIIGSMPDVDIQFDFSQADDMFRHFEEMFKTFGMVELPISRHFETGPEGNSNLRDKMLKDEADVTPDNRVDTLPSEKRIGSFETPSIFGNLWKTPKWDRIRPTDKVDKDLDGELTNDDFDQIASESKKIEPSTSAVKPSGSWGFSKSVSVRTIRRGDGTVEHLKTVKNSDGSEEKTVTRAMDDKSYSVITKRSKDGEEEKVETFRNIDEKSLPEFNQKWSESGEGSSNPRNELVLSDYHDNESKSMFSKFFGSLPGFRSS